MIKVFALLPKRPDLTAEQFHEHWSTVHRGHALRISSLRRYVQAHRIEHPLPGLSQAPFDGVPEVWFDSLESALGQKTDPDYTEYAGKDEPNFVDMTRISWVRSSHRLLRDDLALVQDTPTAKILVFVRRPADQSPAEFADGWPAAADATLDVLPEVRRAAVATALPETYDAATEPPYDGVLELWWPDLASLDASWGRTGDAFVRALGRVADLRATGAMVATELRVIWPPA